MFERLKKVFSREAAVPAAVQSSVLSEWAGTQGFAFAERGEGKGFTIDGQIGRKPWRLEIGKPSRDFIRGEELRARAELGINEDVAVLVMNRPLKESLEKRAYQLYTDSLQTTADPNLPEEMRWLSMYDEVGWDGQPPPFWERYSVLADDREHALAWLDVPLGRQLMGWPEPGPLAEIPFILMLLRGKAYLRMEYSPADMPTLQHAASIFTFACESALANLSVEAGK